MLKIFDLVISFLGLTVGFPVFLVVLIAGYFDTGSPLFFQTRVGKDKRAFNLIKFRTMKLDTASVATHLADQAAVTNLGKFLRSSKLDELPQLWNVLRGEMSLVGPRPCLFNQEELIAERQKLGVFDAKPGITGLAQVNGIDMSDPIVLAHWDAKMLETISVRSYLKYVALTLVGRGTGDKIRPS